MAVLAESRHPEAVHLLTYHGSKGLEWPIVVLTGLEHEAKGNPSGVYAEQLDKPDWRDPLGGRVLRYWPWPYGVQAKDVGLDQGPRSAQRASEPLKGKSWREPVCSTSA